jgi:hypothetical protein
VRAFALDPATATIARLITIARRDGTILRVTTWPRAIHIGGETWLPAPGLKTFDIGERSNGEPASTQLQLSVGSSGIVARLDVEDELYDGADVEIFLTDADSPAAKDFEFFGRIGSWSSPAHDVVTFNLKNPFAFPRHNLVPVFSVMCRFALGDQFCGVPIMRPEVKRSTAYALGESVRHLTGAAPAGYGNVYFETTTAGTTAATAPSYNYSVGATTMDGSAVFTARNAYERACEVAVVVDPHTLTLTSSPDPRAVDNWYAPGKIQFASGRLTNRIYKIGGWSASDLQLTTYLPAGLCAAPGDTALIWKDCDKTIAQCETPFDNVRRFGGFPYYEGAKAVALEQGE